jgi:hypothetical protein
MRHANHFLPDSADGRALLKALLRCKLSADAAKEAARWLEPSELPALQRAAQRVRLHDVGKLVSLTYDERESGRLWLLRPCDVPWPEVQRRTRERGGSLREAFRGAATSGSLRKLVHRTLDQLEGLGVVETELRKGTRGLVRWARKVDLEPALRPDAFCHGDSVTGGIGCRENTKTDDAAKPSGVAKNVRSKPKNRVRCNNGASGYVSSEPHALPRGTTKYGCPKKDDTRASSSTNRHRDRPQRRQPQAKPAPAIGETHMLRRGPRTVRCQQCKSR